jgi:hypothetical protein
VIGEAGQIHSFSFVPGAVVALIFYMPEFIQSICLLLSKLTGKSPELGAVRVVVKMVFLCRANSHLFLPVASTSLFCSIV